MIYQEKNWTLCWKTSSTFWLWCTSFLSTMNCNGSNKVNYRKTRLEHEETLKELHSSVKELQSQLEKKVTNFQKLEAEQDKLCAPPALEDTLSALNKAQREAFDESEEYAEEWVDDGASNVDAFVKEFVAKRKIHHERLAKMELLKNDRVRQAV